jgi:glycosyltransferase involved in cell wall biosynthesis
MTAPRVSVIIPVRPREPLLVMDSLMRQTVQDFEIIVRVDPGKGQAWTRNRAAESARGEYLWFADADIRWHWDALERHLSLFEAMKTQPPWKLGYVYGAYELTDDRDRVISTLCDREWNWEALTQYNFVSTMALLPRQLFMDYLFDESFRRLEDWELWLRMGRQGWRGAYLGGVVFSTQLRTSGVSYSGEFNHAPYEQAIREKLNL